MAIRVPRNCSSGCEVRCVPPCDLIWFGLIFVGVLGVLPTNIKPNQTHQHIKPNQICPHTSNQIKCVAEPQGVVADSLPRIRNQPWRPRRIRGLFALFFRSICARFGSKVDGFVPRNPHVNLSRVRQPEGGTAFLEFEMLGAARDALEVYSRS